MIAVLWILPFTWGAAAANTVIFLAISIPLAIISAFMSDYLQVKPSRGIPSVKCFDKDTLIEMDDGTTKKISNIEIGDILSNNNLVTGKMKLTSKGSTMYTLDNIIVSDSHIVKYGNNLIPVSKHPKSIPIHSYNEDYLYCLNTSHKVIQINNLIFTDWDEIFDNKLEKIIRNTPNHTIQFIHKYLDCGFIGTTKIPLRNTDININKNSSLNLVDIHKININDILENGEKIYGIVEIDGSELIGQFRYSLGENNFVEGYNWFLNNNENLVIEKHPIHKHNRLYHILTDKGTFKLGNIIFKDYNAAIDRFLENN
jgi:hypothetical protein